MDDVARVVIAVQTLRALAYGFGAVVIGSVLASQGLSDLVVGAVFAAMVAGMALSSIVIGRWGDRLGRRRAYRLLLAVMGACGAVFALTSWPPALIVAAITGTLSTDANESGPITSLEQSMLAEAPPERRPHLYGHYNAAAYLAGSLGALLAGGPSALRHALPAVPSDQRWLLAFVVIAAACFVVAGRLPAGLDESGLTTGPARRPLTRSRDSVRRLAALFAVDAFAGGLIVQTFLVFWFARRFGTSTELMSLVLFACGVLQGASSLLAGPLAARIGLLNTMVFTHIPSNVLLAAVAVMPDQRAAIAAVVARAALSQMDVPARQAFIAAIVDPSERTAAAAYTNTARYVGRPGGPALAGALMQVAAGAPFVVAGVVKVAYDVVVYLGFRSVATDEGQRPP